MKIIDILNEEDFADPRYVGQEKMTNVPRSPGQTYQDAALHHRLIKSQSNEPVTRDSEQFKNAMKQAYKISGSIKNTEEFEEDKKSMVFNLAKDFNIPFKDAHDIIIKSWKNRQFNNLDKGIANYKKKFESGGKKHLRQWFKQNKNASKHDVIEKGRDFGVSPIQSEVLHRAATKDIPSGNERENTQICRRWLLNHADTDRKQFIKFAINKGMNVATANDLYNRVNEYIYHNDLGPGKWKSQQPIKKGSRVKRGSHRPKIETERWFRENEDASKEEFMQKAKEFGMTDMGAKDLWKTSNNLFTGDSPIGKANKWLLKNKGGSVNDWVDKVLEFGGHPNSRKSYNQAMNYLRHHGFVKDLRESKIKTNLKFMNYLLES